MIPVYILWVEDNRSWVESIEDLLRESASSLGFDLRFDQHPDGRHVDDILRNIDMEIALIDHNLPGNNGDFIIREIRKRGYNTQVIYYTANPDLDLSEGIKDLPNVTCILRDHVEDQLITCLKEIKKQQI